MNVYAFFVLQITEIAISFDFDFYVKTLIWTDKRYHMTLVRLCNHTQS